MSKTYTVMISSTARDLPEHREEALDACLRQKFLPRMMEHLSASNDDAIAASLRMVDECDIYLGIYAWRYGYIPQGHARSITEMEYDHAVKRDIPRLLFLMHEDHPTNGDDVEKGDGGAKLEEFRKRVSTERVVNFFKSPGELGKQIIDSLVNLRNEIESSEQNKPNNISIDTIWPRYREKLNTLFGTIRILGKPEPVKIQDIYTDVDVYKQASTVFGHAIQRTQGWEDRHVDLPSTEGIRIDGWERIRQGGNLCIGGQPGAGKTTFLQHILLSATEQTDIEYVPIYVSLHEWATSGDDDIKSIIAKQFKSCGVLNPDEFIDALLCDNRTLVLFDGLDEINQNDNRRKKFVDLLGAFTEEYEQAQYIVTGRIPLPSQSIRPSFTDIKIADFTDEQVQHYVDGWFNEEQLSRKFIAELNKSTNKSVRALSHTPLHLSLLCCAFSPGVPLPQSRARLFESAIHNLLSQWDRARNIHRDAIYVGLSDSQINALYAEIAVHTFDTARIHFDGITLVQLLSNYLSNYINTSSIQAIDYDRVLDEMVTQHGILIRRSQTDYSFVQLTFQEYFTARYIIDHKDSTKPIQLIREHLTETRWREVFLFVAGLMNESKHDVREFFNVFLSETSALIASEPHAQDLLVWAEQEARKHHTSTRLKIFELRLLYILMARAYLEGGYLAHGLSIDLEYATVTAYYLDFVEDLSFMVGVLRDREIPIPLIIRPLEPTERTQPPGLFDIDLPFDCECIQALAHKTNSHIALIFGLLYAHQLATVFADAGDSDGDEEDLQTLKQVRQHVPQYIDYIALLTEIANALANDRLNRSLQELQIPSEHDSRRVWHVFAKELHTLIPFEPPAAKKQWQFEEEHFSNFHAYLQATELLMRCLECIESSDIRRMDEQLFLPLSDIDNTKTV